MTIFGLLIFADNAEIMQSLRTSSVTQDQCSETAKNQNAFHFLHVFMATFRQMFRNRTEVLDHFNYYDDQVKGTDCHIQGNLDFTRLKDYFERYARTHRDPKISIIFAIMTKYAVYMTVEFHVTSQTWLGFEDNFHMIIRAFNNGITGATSNYDQIVNFVFRFNRAMRFLLPLIFLMMIPSSSSECFEWTYLKCWPTEIQEMVEMVLGKNNARYNCSIKTQAEWYETGEVRIGWGIYYILSGIFFQIIGWPVLWIFFFKFNLTSTLKVYRVMVFIGLIEISEVWGNSVWPGVVALFGEVYCTSPRMTAIVGKTTMVQWLLGSASAVFLGFHRLSDMAGIGEWLVNTNWKTGSWLFFLVVYAFYGSFFYDTVLFNSVYMAPLLDPMIGQPGITYSNKFLYFHNIAAALLLISVYLGLCLIWSSRESHTSSVNVSKFQRSVLLQSICISLTYAVPAISFVTMFVMNTPKWFFHLSDITYQLSGGLPFFMYIWLNHKVREEFMKLLGMCRNATKRNKVVVVPVVNSTITCFNN